MWSARFKANEAVMLACILADKTGGEAWFPNFETAFHDAMEGVIQDLATQYKLVVKGAIPRDGRAAL